VPRSDEEVRGHVTILRGVHHLIIIIIITI